MHRTLPAALAALGLLAAPPGDTHAAESAYTAELAGSGSFEHVERVTNEHGTWTQRTRLALDVRATIDEVVFRDNRLVVDEQVGGDATVAVTGETSIVAVGLGGERRASCTAAPSSGTARAELAPDLVTPLTGDEALVVRATDDLPVEWTCDGDLDLGPGGHDTTMVTGPIGDGPLDAAFTLPPEAMAAGKVVQLAAGPPDSADQRCPGQSTRTVSCTGGWSGQLTLTRFRGGPSSPPPAESPAPRPAPAPAPPATRAPGEPTSAELEDLLVPLVVPSRARLSDTASTMSFTAGCATGCPGTATVTVRGRRVAALRFRVPAGPARTVRLRLPAAARRAVRRHRRATIAVVLRPRGAAPRRARLSAALPRR